MTLKTEFKHTFPPRVEDLDDYTIRWGKYQGTPLILIPADYLLWVRKNCTTTRPVNQYLMYGRKQLEKEVRDGVRKCPECSVRWDGIECVMCDYKK